MVVRKISFQIMDTAHLQTELAAGVAQSVVDAQESGRGEWIVTDGAGGELMVEPQHGGLLHLTDPETGHIIAKFQIQVAPIATKEIGDVLESLADKLLKQ